jgi:hypothetical protein
MSEKPFGGGKDKSPLVDDDDVAPELDDKWFQQAEIRNGDQLIRPGLSNEQYDELRQSAVEQLDTRFGLGKTEAHELLRTHAGAKKIYDCAIDTIITYIRQIQSLQDSLGIGEGGPRCLHFHVENDLVHEGVTREELDRRVAQALVDKGSPFTQVLINEGLATAREATSPKVEHVITSPDGKRDPKTLATLDNFLDELGIREEVTEFALKRVDELKVGDQIITSPDGDQDPPHPETSHKGM